MAQRTLEDVANEYVTDEEWSQVECDDDINTTSELVQCEQCGQLTCIDYCEILNYDQYHCNDCLSKQNRFECLDCIRTNETCPFDREYSYCYDCSEYIDKSKLHTLKLESKFVQLIKDGTKQYDVRKINKDAIKKNDFIQFIDPTTKENTLLVRVENKIILEREQLSDEFDEFTYPIDQISDNHKIDLDTWDFCFENYKEEEKLILFTIEEVVV